MRRERIVAQYRVPRLDQVVGADHRESDEQNERNFDEDRSVADDEFSQENRGECHDNGKDNETRVEWQKQGAHDVSPPADTTYP